MAGADMEINVGANTSEATTKLAQLKAQLNEMKSGVDLTQKVLQDFNQSLKLNERSIAEVSKQLKGMIINSKQSAAEAEALKRQLAGLNVVNSTLAKNISQTKIELAQETAAMKLQAAAVKSAEAAGSGFSGGLSKIWSGLRNIAYVIPGLGIGGLVAILAGPLIEGFTALIEKIRGVKTALIDMTDFNKSVGESFGKDSAGLMVLRSAIEDSNLPMKTRLQAIKDLRKEFPGLFDDFTEEELLNKKVAGAYDIATQAILKKARATAAAAELGKLETEKLKLQLKIQQDLNDTFRKIATAKPIAETISGGTGGVGGFGGVSIEAVRKNILEKSLIQKKADEAEIQEIVKKENFFLQIAEQGAVQTIKVEKEKNAHVEKEAIRHFKAMKDIMPEFLDEAAIKFKLPSNVEADFIKSLRPIKPEEILNGIMPPEVFSEATMQGELLAMGITTGIQDGLKTGIKGLRFPQLTELWKDSKVKLEEFSRNITMILENSLEDMVIGLADAIGSGKNIFGSFMKLLGDGLKSLGSYLIRTAIEIKAIKAGLKSMNPYLIAAAGVALVILGSIIQKQAKIPGFASGVRNFSGGVALVGERGPELVRLPKGSDVIPNGQMNSMLSGGGTQVFIPNVTLRGQDLVLAFSRASQTISRNG
jgi:hypothetical protein